MTGEDNLLKKEKRKKREKILEEGINPYPYNYKKQNNSLELSQKYKDLKEGESSSNICSLAGRIMRRRDMGKAAFFNIQDEEGEFQCYIKKENFLEVKTKDNSWNIWKLSDIGDIVGVCGSVFRTKKGELSLRVQDLKMLCKTLEILPEKYHGLEDKELKYRYRHLDLIMDAESKKTFKIRSQIISEIRKYMDAKGFMEVETPVLQPIYGGAAAVPFKTYFRRLDSDMYLKISPEMYLKKLIVGGFEKVYEIGKNFRNEGIDRTHNPEFTMMEYYESYTDYEYQMNQFEDIVCFVTKKIKGSLKFEYQGKKLDFTKPWKRLSVKEAIKEYGQFDPDKISYESLLEKLQSLDSEGDFEKFINNKKIGKEDLKDELIMLAFEMTAEKHLWNPTFIKDFPLSVSPLTKKHRQHQEDKKYERIVERFEPIIAGMEVGNAYSELNDPVDQKERLENQNRNPAADGTTHPMDKNFIHALEVGMPPTGGVGLGIERLVMILTDKSHIKDSLLFPVLKNK